VSKDTYLAQQTPHTLRADFKVHLLPKLQTACQHSLRLRNLPHIIVIVSTSSLSLAEREREREREIIVIVTLH